ncbi:Helix-loop-helix protein 6 [Halotydeus destructor]|nr:Helix-loop-helix protein 6 [Halotydeus destructor]
MEGEHVYSEYSIGHLPDNGDDQLGGQHVILTPLNTVSEATLYDHNLNYVDASEVYYAYNETRDSPVASEDSFDQRAEEQFNMYNYVEDANFQGEDGTALPDDKKPDPFSEQCRIPIPGLENASGFYDTRTFVRRRNERERARVRNVNEGFERLRSRLPALANDPEPKDRRLSKVETLRHAIEYIRELEDILDS